MTEPAVILELKVKSSCEQALQQIKDKNYMQKVKDCREILLVGISYNEKNITSAKLSASL